MSYTLYELALNPELQKKVQTEVDAVLAESKNVFTEEALGKFTFLEQCLMETVRTHCPVFGLSKLCIKETEFPGQFENSTNTLKIEEGMNVVIPVYALHLWVDWDLFPYEIQFMKLSIHSDKDYFPDPFTYNPDRWSPENRESIPKYAFLGFGEGPRICLGMKFGLTQVKAGVAAILSQYDVKAFDKTEIPIKFSKSTFVLEPVNGIWLKFVKRVK